MKMRTTKIILFVLAGIFSCSAIAMADDIKVVEWADADGFVKMNALHDAINEDLDEDGNFIGPDNRVYQLKNDGFYWITERIEARFPLRIVGEEPAAGKSPPVLQNRHDADDSWDETMIVSQNDLELRNIWIVGRTEQGNEGWGLIDIAGDNSTVVIDNIVLEYNFSAVIHNLAPGTDFSLTNSHFRNLIDHSQYWAGRIFRTEAPTKRIFVENNTFFNIGHTIIQVRHPEGEFWFNHNTVVNTGRHVVSAEGVQWQNAYIANNLMINGQWHGEIEDDFSPVREQEEDNQYTTWVSLDYIDPTLGFEDQRRVGILNNAHWVHPTIWDYYDEYPEDVPPDAGAPDEGVVRAADFLNVRGHDLVAEWDGIKFENHLDLVGEDLGLQFHDEGHFDKLAVDMMAWIQSFRAGVETSEYYWEMQGRPTGPGELTPSVRQIHPIAQNAENFTYAHSEALTNAIGGYPVGDLNWYPEEKQDWLAERDQLEQEIRDQFEEPDIFHVVADFEAEDGHLSGDATAKYFDGFEYYFLEGGEIVWTFDMEEGGEFGIDLHHNKGDEGDRGQHIIVNGENLLNYEDYGEYYFPGDQPQNTWLVEEIRNEDLFEGEIELQEGRNTIILRASWGYQYFHGLDIVDTGGNVVKDMSIFDGDIRGASGSVTCEDVQDGQEVPFCPSGGGWVDFDSGGEVSFDIEFGGTGDYNVQFFYMLESGTASADLEIGGQFKEIISFEEATGEAEVTVASAYIEEGTQGITVNSAAGGFNLDRVQVFTTEDVWTSSRRPKADLPRAYQLYQNYPNPFNPATNIKFELQNPSDITLTVYDALGRRVSTLAEGRYQEGVHMVQFNPKNLASGVYIYRLQAGDVQITRQMMFIK